jgi:anthranilate phosphoribosyltransferase
MIKEAIGKLVQGIDLERKEMILCMTEIMTGQATQAQIGSFITSLRLKGESVEEITGAAMVMRDKAVNIDINRGKKAIDQETIIDTSMAIKVSRVNAAAQTS